MGGLCASMKRCFPDRPIVDLAKATHFSHGLWTWMIATRCLAMQVTVPTHRIPEKDGFVPRWRGIYDDKHRVMVAICHNMDLGD